MEKYPIKVPNDVLKTRINVFTVYSFDPNVNLVEYLLGKFGRDSVAFYEFVLYLIEVGYLQPYDNLVGDNARIHVCGYCEEHAKPLWNEYRVLCLPLPPYVPELNPTEELFRTLVKRLRSL